MVKAAGLMQHGCARASGDQPGDAMARACMQAAAAPDMPSARPGGGSGCGRASMPLPRGVTAPRQPRALDKHKHAEATHKQRGGITPSTTVQCVPQQAQ